MSLENTLAENTVAVKQLTEAINHFIAQCGRSDLVVSAKATTGPAETPTPPKAQETNHLAPGLMGAMETIPQPTAPATKAEKAPEQKAAPSSDNVDLKALRAEIRQRVQKLFSANQEAGRAFLQRLGVKQVKEITDARLVEAKIALDAFRS